ncbi:polyhydroxyalkanoate synthesis repressor PhaR [Rhizomicrobium palustre]|uniref:Polyhydroxyalkanoate synthesis repressor PhaR n=1 Tax=Rhizomicrobium palustre TaxID=189966 RepID=A0A846N0G6_9PROT|nr:polyhydroxyalkanoate synthesis repressor PhaR [Rhizomicrobium palustre]
MAEDLKRTEAPVVIKKYANRRLYNTESSSYVTLDHLAQMVKQGVSFEVQDARTGEDITRSVLTQIIFEEEAKGQNLLPINFLRQLIRFYGDPMQAFVPGFLDLSMDGFVRNEDEMRRRIAHVFGGGKDAMEALAKQNMAAFERAVTMFTPRVVDEPAPPAPAQPAPSDLSELKSEIEEMRRQLLELSQRK